MPQITLTSPIDSDGLFTVRNEDTLLTYQGVIPENMERRTDIALRAYAHGLYLNGFNHRAAVCSRGADASLRTASSYSRNAVLFDNTQA